MHENIASAGNPQDGFKLKMLRLVRDVIWAVYEKVVLLDNLQDGFELKKLVSDVIGAVHKEVVSSASLQVNFSGSSVRSLGGVLTTTSPGVQSTLDNAGVKKSWVVSEVIRGVLKTTSHRVQNSLDNAGEQKS